MIEFLKLSKRYQQFGNKKLPSSRCRFLLSPKVAIVCLAVLAFPLVSSAEPISGHSGGSSSNASSQSPQIVSHLRGICFHPAAEKVYDEPLHSEGVASHGVVLLDQHPQFMQELHNKYVGRPFSQADAWVLKTDIARFYCDQGQPFVRIAIPTQNLSMGVVQVLILEPALGEVLYKGNEYYPPERLRSFLSVKSGSVIDGRQLVKDMARMNENPFRRTDVIFRPGKKPDTVDLELLTIDRSPYRFYMGADNTGTVQTERDRFFFGVNLGKTIVEDSEISYQFTSSPNWNRFVAQTALFRVPFPAKQTFIAYGGYSQVQPELPEPNRKEKSLSWQVDARYRIPIITNSQFLQELIFGFDFKQVIARIKQDAEVVFHRVADIDQFMVGYDLGHRGRYHKVSLQAELYAAPGGISYGNTKKCFSAFRPGSGPAYAYLKLLHSFAYRFNHCWFSYNLSGQISTKNLLPSEQFTLSGYHAVRGFEERIVNVDNALLCNVVFETPRLSISKFAGWTRRSYDELYFLGFFDFGVGGNTNPLSNESRTVSLGSLGPGIRYQIDRYLTARFDYGFQLWHHGFQNPSSSRYNFGLIVSF